MLGFIFGALTVLMFPRRAPPPPATPPPSSEPAPAPTLKTPRLTTIEAMFETYGKYAVWDNNDTTEVSLWNPDTRQFSDAYEVLRSGDKYYFRSISKLHRRILKHGVPEDAPLQFTETEESYKAWSKDVDAENNARFQNSLRVVAPKPPGGSPEAGKPESNGVK